MVNIESRAKMLDVKPLITSNSRLLLIYHFISFLELE